MTYRELYSEVDKRIRTSTSGVERVPTFAGGAIWRQGVYSVRLFPTGPDPFWVRLDRRGGRKPPLDFYDGPKVVDELVDAIKAHFANPRNAL